MQSVEKLIRIILYFNLLSKFFFQLIVVCEFCRCVLRHLEVCVLIDMLNSKILKRERTLTAVEALKSGELYSFLPDQRQECIQYLN